MKTEKKTIIFECDRCGDTKERNINERSGTTLSFKSTHDMTYGNNTTGNYDLCQKCTKTFNDFMKNPKDYEDFEHHYHVSVGLHCTDRPDLVDDSLHRVLFEIEQIKDK